MNDPEQLHRCDDGSPLHPITAAVLDRFSHRRRWLLICRVIAVTIVTLAVTMALVAILDHFLFLSTTVRGLLSGAAYLITALVLWWTSLRFLREGPSSNGRRGEVDSIRVARQIETLAPQFREDLLSAVELSDPELANGSQAFRDRLQQIASRRVAGLDLPQVLPVGLLRPWLISAALIVCIVSLLFFVPHLQFGRRIARVMLVGAPIQRASLTKIRILKPDPASRYVAQGDAIAIVVRVDHLQGIHRIADVVLEYRHQDAAVSRLIMTARANHGLANSSSQDPTTIAYAANLAVGKTPMHYRIQSGDAITLWETLTPRPRPKVKRFIKRYQYPSYTQLDETTEESEHGDLEAFSGTTARLTVEFDQPVSAAVIKYGNRGVELPLESVEGSSRLFRINVPMKTPGQYQIDAVSIASQLNNPFSPQYMISPRIDRKPSVRWQHEIEKTYLAAPTELIELGGLVTDDLPTENVFQEFSISGKKGTFKRNIQLETPQRELELSWQWDLINPTNSSSEQSEIVKFESGDIVHTQLVAIDRAGKRAESSMIEVLIVEPSFDSHRHDSMQRLRETLSQIADWSERIEKQLSDLQKPIRQLDGDAYRPLADSILHELEHTTRWIDRMKLGINEAEHFAAAGTLELLARSILSLDASIRSLDFEVRDVIHRDQEPWRNKQQHFGRELADRSQRFSQISNRIENLSRAIIAYELSINVVADEMALLGSIGPLVDARRKVPVNRFPHFMNVAATRLEALTNLIDRNHQPLPDSTIKYFDRWQSWGERWIGSLRDLGEQNLSFDEIQRRLEQFRGELNRQTRHSSLDGSIASQILKNVRQLQKDTSYSGLMLGKMRSNGELARNEQRQLDREKSTDTIVLRTQSMGYAEASFAARYDQLVQRLTGDEALHRSRKFVDLQFAADMKLFRRAMETVAKTGYLDYEDKPAPEIFDELRKAFVTLESAHDLQMFRREIAQLADDETDLVDRAATRLDHPLRLERFQNVFRFPIESLQAIGVSWDIVKPIHEAFSGAEYQLAASRIVKRRWGDEELVSAETPLRMFSENMERSLTILDPLVIEARRTIAKYVPSIAEIARAAAKKAEQAKDSEKTPSQPTQAKPPPEELPSKSESATPADAVAAARETIEALHDFANTAKIVDQQQQELARDADTAAQQIHSAIEEVERSQNQSQASHDDKNKELDELADTLKRTADHFEKADHGEDLQESREMLRQLEKEMGIQTELEERFERAKAMAKAAQSTPEELLRKLEKELNRNPEMREQLNKIADRTSETVQQDLEQMARDERQINQSLQRSDSSILERKRRATREMQTLAHDLAMLDRAMLDTVRHAQDWGNLQQEKESLQRSRQQVQDVIQQVHKLGGENALLKDIQVAAHQAAMTMKKAEEHLEKVAKDASENTEDDIHENEKNLQNAQRQIKNSGNNARRKRLDQTRQNRNHWVRFENEAKQRLRNAQRRERDAQRQIDQLKQRWDREENHRESIEGQIDQIQIRKDLAKRELQTAKLTENFAQQRKKQSEQRRKNIEKTPLPDLDAKNPAAQLAEYYADEARLDLKSMRKRLGEISREVDALEELRSPAAHANSLAKQQQRIANDVGGAAEALRRAARHEDRLDEPLTSEQLEEAAERIDRQALQASQMATEGLRAAVDEEEQSPEASRRVEQAEQEIRASAEHLAQMLAKAPSESATQDGDPQPSQPKSTPPTGDPTTRRRSPEQMDDASRKAKQLAQTLDELDQAVHGNAPPEDSPQQPEDSGEESAKKGKGEESSESQREDGQPQSNQPQSNQGKPSEKPGNAAQASKTLAESINEFAQQAARQRAESLKPKGGSRNPNGSKPGQQPGKKPQPGKNKNGKPSDKPGQGTMPAGGSFDASDIRRTGEDWGDLRSQRTDDATQGTSIRVPREYRREIEAYFRAIAQQSSGNGESRAPRNPKETK